MVIGYDFKNEDGLRSRIANIKFNDCDHLKSLYDLSNNKSFNICKTFAVADNIEVLAPFNMFHLIGTDDEALPVLCGEEQFGIMSNVLQKEGSYIYHSFWTLTAGYLRWIGKIVQEDREFVPEVIYKVPYAPDEPFEPEIPMQYPQDQPPVIPELRKSFTSKQHVSPKNSKPHLGRRYTCPERGKEGDRMRSKKSSAVTMETSFVLLYTFLVKHLISFSLE